MLKEPDKRASKPPVTKVKCGLDLNQHELSAIQEVESPKSGRTSVPGKQFDKRYISSLPIFCIFSGC